MGPLFAAIFQKVEDPALNEATLREELTPLLKQLGQQVLHGEEQIMVVRQDLDYIRTRITQRFSSDEGRRLGALVYRTAQKILPPIPDLPEDMWKEILVRTEEPGRLSVDRAMRQLSDAEKRKRVESGELDVRVFGCTSAKEAIQCIKERQLFRADLTVFRVQDEELIELIRDCPHLTELLLPIGQPVVMIPPEIGTLKNLKKLQCRDGLYQPLPAEIGQLTQLEELRVVVYSPLPTEIGNLRALKSLFATNFSPVPFPRLKEKLPNLKTLDLQDQFTHHEIYLMKQLETLGLHWNFGLTPEIQNLTQLKVLDLSGNTVSLLPDEIGLLQNLHTLNLRDTGIAMLPDAIGNLANLRDLDLRETGVRSLPESFGNLENLTILKLHFNPFLQARAPIPPNLEEVEFYGARMPLESFRAYGLERRERANLAKCKEELIQLIPELLESFLHLAADELPKQQLAETQDLLRLNLSSQNTPDLLMAAKSTIHTVVHSNYAQNFEESLREMSNLVDLLQE